MRLLLLLLVVLLIAAVVVGVVLLVTGRLRAPGWAVRRPNGWTTDTAQRDDGTTLVLVRRDGEPPRTVRELPAGQDAVDHRLELEDALREADEHARVLNRERS